MHLRQQSNEFMQDFIPIFVTVFLLSLTALYTVVVNYEDIMDAIAYSDFVERILPHYLKSQENGKIHELVMRPTSIHCDINEV
jgi:hypothetical protein